MQRKFSTKRTAVSLLLVVLMLFTLLPNGIFAATEDDGTPIHEKVRIDNGDGTYTLQLSVTGDAEKAVTKANVIVVLDASNSMYVNNTGNTEVTYTPTDGNGDNLYGLIDGEYVPLTRQGRGANSTYWYNGEQYTDQRYTRQVNNQNRMEVCESDVTCFVAALSGLKCSTLILYKPQMVCGQGENHGKGRVQKN